MSKQIPAILAEVLDYDAETGVLTWNVERGGAGYLRRARSGRAGTVVKCQKSSYEYRAIQFMGHKYAEHRVAWFLHYGEQPPEMIDHINDDALDNRIVNLQETTESDNPKKRSKSTRNTSGHTGVSQIKSNGKWMARITHNGEVIHLGCFEDVEDAVEARKNAELEYRNN